MRSDAWYRDAGGNVRDAYIHRAWMRRGTPEDSFDGRPHIAIANTASDLTPCNAHLDEVAAAVKAGVWEAGGVPHLAGIVTATGQRGRGWGGVVTAALTRWSLHGQEQRLDITEPSKGNAIHGLLALLYEPDLSPDIFFERGKRLNILLSMVLLGIAVFDPARIRVHGR